MRNKKLIILMTVGLMVVSSAFLIKSIFAQDETAKANIRYPVAELGGCASKVNCKNYCDKPENIENCISFAQNNGLMTKEEVTIAKKFVSSDNSQKPGKCTTKDSCEEYCNDMNHMDECLAFAEKNNILPPEELVQAKKIQAAIAKGIKPPACGNKKACDAYCDSSEHMEECMNFAMEAGFMDEQEKTDSQKMLTAIKRGVKPPSCKGKTACDEYCSDPNNMEECMNFAMEAGFMDEQEKANSQKMLTAIKKGATPPKCKGKEECDKYCQEEGHFEECLNFAEVAGFMSPEEAIISRKTGGKGPGDCKGKEECDAFCNNPDNQETCFSFGKENGLIPEQDLKRMEEGKQQFKESLSQAPQTVLDCLNTQIGSEMLEKIKSGTVMPPKEIGESMRGCYEKMGPPKLGEPGEGGMIPPAGQTGPGGCKTLEECKSYCEKNPQECQNFQNPQGPGSQETSGQQGPNDPNKAQGPDGQSMQAGPGGCKNQEECQSYCQTNPQECRNFQGQQGQNKPQGASGPQDLNGQMPQQGMGMSNCNSPEECQKIAPQNMASPAPCQGENCAYGPPPNGTMSGPEGQMPQQYQQPRPNMPQGPMPSSVSGGGTGGTMPAGTQQPMPQAQPMPQPQTGPTNQMAPQPQTAPQPQIAPTPSESTPPPTGLNNPNLFMSFILSVFGPLSHPFLYEK